MESLMPLSSKPSREPDDELETAVDQAISACGGDMRAAIRALLVANDYLESEVGELMKAVSHAYARGRFGAYSG
jgi:DNA anti-recombination protein RmuC